MIVEFIEPLLIPKGRTGDLAQFGSGNGHAALICGPPLCHLRAAMTIARISELERKTTQSGKANTGRWLLEFERQQAQRPDPLTGWNGSGDTNTQVRLTFPTQGRGDRLLRQARPRLSPRRRRAGPAQDPGLRRQLPLVRPLDDQ